MSEPFFIEPSQVIFAPLGLEPPPVPFSGGGLSGFVDVMTHPQVFGDRINDDAPGLIDAVQQADSEGKGVYFPTRPGYYITQEIPFPRGMVWQGDRPWVIDDGFLTVQSFLHVGGGQFEVTLDPSTEFNLNKLIPEDAVRFIGVSDAVDNAGSYGLVSMDNTAKSFIVRHPTGAGSEIDVSVAPDGATSFHNVIEEGSLLIFRNLDGLVSDGNFHLNSSSNKNFAIRNMGFVGAGVNSQFSGGLVFSRDTSGQNPRTLAPIEHFIIENFRISHCSTPAALDMRGALNGIIRGGELVRNVFVNLALNRGDDGGSNTMTEVSEIFTHQCTVPFYARQAVYCKFWNIVAEGSSLGLVLDDCRACDVHWGWETLKFSRGFGYPVLQLRSNDMRIGAGSGFWNTEEAGYSKAGITIAGESANSQETLSAVIEAPYHQGSYNRVPVLVVQAASNGLAGFDPAASRTGKIHVDATQFQGFNTPGFDMNDGPAYWSPPRMLTFDNLASVNSIFADFNHFRYTLTRRPEIKDPPDNSATSPPGASDDGFTILDQWLDTNTGFTWICIDNSTGAAVWRRFIDVWVIEFEGKFDVNIAPTTAPGGAHATRRGRNFGVDISAHWPLWWSVESRIRPDGALKFYFDLEDFFPVKVVWKIEFVTDPNSNLGNTRLFSRSATKATITNPETDTPEDVIRFELNASALQPGKVSAATQTAGQQLISIDSNRDIVRDAGSFVDDGFLPGMSIKLLGFDDPNNQVDRTFTVETVDPLKIVLFGDDGLPDPETGSGDEKVAAQNGYIWENTLVRHENGVMTMDQFSTGWKIRSDFKEDDEATGVLYMYARVERIAATVAPRNKLKVKGAMVDAMNGNWTVRSILWSQFVDRGGFSSSDAIEIITEELPAAGLPGRGDTIQALDTAAVILRDDDDFDRTNRTAVHLRASNHIEVWDEQGIVQIAPEVDKPAVIPDAATSVDVYHSNAEALDWLAVANGELVTTEVIDRTTVRVSRSGTTGDLAVNLRGTPKRRRKPADLFGEDRGIF